MNRRLARALVLLYPRAWRERYGSEFAELLEDGSGGPGTALNVMAAALSQRLFPTIGDEMNEASGWKKWSARAPWALFGVAPLLLLASAYFVALFILWSGWQIFLPGQPTPFLTLNGWAIAYFGLGRLLYFVAPMLVGLAVAWTATRARVKALWPVVGMALIAWADGMAQVQTKWPNATGSGKVWMTLEFGRLGNAPELLAISVLVYLLLRMRRERLQTP